MELHQYLQRRLKYGDILSRRAQVRREHIIRVVLAALREDSPHLTEAAVADVFDARCARFARHHAALRAAVADRDREGAEDAAARANLSAHVEQARARVEKARNRIEQVLGRDGVSRYRISGETPRQPDALKSALTLTVERLRADPTTTTDDFGGTFSTLTLADTLTADLTTLSQAIEHSGAEADETTTSQRALDAAGEAWQRAVRAFALSLEADLRTAGLDAEADRIRPTSRRVRGEEAVEDTPDTPDTPDAPSAGEPSA